jgi:UDP-N-acetylglucosamine/UDP-N-acetylgalactosamine diphosphorylase
MKFKEGYRLVEYSEMTKEDCEKKSGKHLYYRYGSPAIHVFDRAFLEREADKNMPLHLAFKKIPFVDMSGRPITPKVPNGYKFEKFIFDLLPNAKKVAFLAFEKKDEFSPVKNAEGDDSPATCKRDMMSKWRKELYKYGIEMTENSVFEVDAAKFCFGGK